MSDYRDGGYVGGGYRSGSADPGDRPASEVGGGSRGGSTDPGDRSASDIEREVEDTRAGVAQTLGALRDKLSPGQVMDQVMDYARGSGGADFARNLGTQVRDNPLPLLLIGAGVAWLMMSGGRPAARRYEDDYDDDRRLLAAPAGRAGAYDYGTGGAGGYADRTGYSPGDYDSPVSSYAAGEAYGAMPRGDTGGGIGDAAARARDAVAGAAGRVGDTASGLAGRAAGAASSAAEGVADAASSAYRGVAGAASSAYRAVADAASGVAGAVSGAADSAGGAVDAASRRARMAMHDGRDAASRYGRQAGGAVEDGWSRLVHDQPLILGAIGLVVGAAVGAALPRTEAEDRLMGETRDDLARQAQSLASEAAADVKERAGEHLGRVQEAVTGAAGAARERLDQGGLVGAVREAGGVLASVAGEVKEAVRGAVNEAADQAKGAVDRAGAKADDATRAPATDRDAPRPATGPVPDGSRTNPL